MKTLEQLGAAASCRVGREDILYQFDVLREYVPIALPLMLANVLCPSILPEEVAAAHEHVAEVRQNLESNVESLVCELLHLTAYKGNTLGNELYADEKDLPRFTAEAINGYLRRECTPDKLIVVGVNVDFDELCKWTARGFADQGVAATAPSAPATFREMAKAVYTGGDFRMEKPDPLCHFMLGWEVEGGWNGPLLASVTVLQMFLGGGGSFSTGGPGKGMHTRLYTEVLNRHQWVESCQASSVMYADTGLFTIYGTILPQHCDDFVTVLTNIFKSLDRITPEELQRAKNALKSSIHMNLEMRAVMMEDIGRQLILSGKVGTASEFGKMVDAVTAQDLRHAVLSCLRTTPTVVAYGAIEKVPPYESIKRRLAAVPGVSQAPGASPRAQAA
jgi:processing peptidase subunit alpha